MANQTTTQRQRPLDIGTGIALGAAGGLIFGLLFMGDNLGAGIGIGAAMGVLAALMFSPGRRTDRILLCALAGADLGAVFGAGAGLLHGAYAESLGRAYSVALFGLPYKEGYVGLGALGLGLLGMVIGLIFDLQRAEH